MGQKSLIDERPCPSEFVLVLTLGDQEGSHASTSASTQRVGDLEALQAIAGLGLLADNVQNRVDQLCSLSVVTLGPVVSSSSLAEDKVVRAEDLAEGARADGVHGAGLEIHKDSAGNVASCNKVIRKRMI